jgi:hypothetical protein
VKSMDAEGAIAALNDSFEAMIRKIVPWLSSATAKREKLSRDPMAP